MHGEPFYCWWQFWTHVEFYVGLYQSSKLGFKDFRTNHLPRLFVLRRVSSVLPRVAMS
jgi:hypothetical protein